MVSYTLLIKCNKCQTRMYGSELPKQYLDHIKNNCFQVIKLPSSLYDRHRPFQSYAYFLYNTLKQLNIIGKYMTWNEWNCYQFSKYSGLFYNEWRDSLRLTCYNIPCDKCFMKDAERRDRYKEMKRLFKERGYRTTKSGMKIPL